MHMPLLLKERLKVMPLVMNKWSLTVSSWDQLVILLLGAKISQTSYAWTMPERLPGPYSTVANIFSQMDMHTCSSFHAFL